MMMKAKHGGTGRSCGCNGLDWDTEDIVLKPLLRWRLIKILDDREADDVHDQGKIKKL